MSWFVQLLSNFSLLFLFSALVIPLEERVEQRAVMKFMVKSGLSPIQCWHQLQQVHGVNCMSKNRVCVWHRRFRTGWTETKDQKHPECPKLVWIPATIQAVNQTIQGQCRLTVRELAEDLSLSKSSVHNIIYKDLKLSKIAPKFIPKDLNQAQKDQRVNVSRDNIQLVKDDPTLLQHVVTCDESWVSVFELDTKQASTEWYPKGTRVNRP